MATLPDTKLQRILKQWGACRPGRMRVGGQRIDQAWMDGDNAEDLRWLVRKIVQHNSHLLVEVPERLRPALIDAGSALKDLWYYLSANGVRYVADLLVRAWARQEGLPRYRKGWR